MNKKPTNIEYNIEKDRIDSIFKRSNTATVALFAVCTVYLFLLTKEFSWIPLLGWYLVLLTVLSGRLLLSKQYFTDTREVKPLSFWLKLFRVGIFLSGATIGSLNYFFFVPDPLSILLIEILVPYGIAVAALTWLLDYFAFSLYLITLMSPIVIRAVTGGDSIFEGAGVLTIVLVVFLLRFSSEYNKNYIISLRLRYENKELLEEIEAEKNKLNNRLGRILNDSSTEIYVADAKTFTCLQVNQGAIENLGYTKEEFNHIRLLDIFADLDEQAFHKLLAPLHSGRMEPIVHKGINRRKDGSTYPVEARIQLSTLDDPPIIVANVQDITERTQWEKKLIYQANYDQLTDLHNRYYMQSYMHSVFTRARRYKKKVALLFLDLDNFKTINDTLGHDVGDTVLQMTASRISSRLRESDTAARTGGDEFTILLENLEVHENAEVVASKLVKTFQEPFRVKGQEVYTTISLGISLYPDDGNTLDQLMQCADMAMYQAKNDGRNNYRFFSHEMRQFSEEQMLISNHLRYALAQNELSIVYQPKIDVSRGKIIGAEALLRWTNQELGNISPSVFMPLAEKLGLIQDLGSWVLVKACEEALKWQDLTDEKLHVSVNVSPQQFRSGTMLDAVDYALEKSGLMCEQLELEITESLLMQDSDLPLSILKNLNTKGIRLALDDFGTGYSSLSYLRRFPLQILKIDRSFIRDLETDSSHSELVKTIIAMGHSLNMEIVAEGVENEEQLKFLRQHNVEIIQGFYFSPPVPPENFRKLLQSDMG